MAAVNIVSGNLFGRHDCHGHPESQDRLVQALSGVSDGIPVVEPLLADASDLLQVHTQLYIDMIRDSSASLPEHQCRYLDPDTYITRHSYDVARYAAGAAIQSVDSVQEDSSWFALVRPPGHHAGSSYYLGFCIFNNAAIAAVYALNRFDRVAIVDWDVHHGNGTQDIFYHSDRVLYCSVHQAFIFPGTGMRKEQGIGPGKGFTINAPLPAGSSYTRYRQVFIDDFLPAIRNFEPGLIIVSAGQDCLFDDPLGNMDLYPDDIGAMTLLLFQTGIPLVLLLEGGYGPSHPRAIASIIQNLCGS
jgi:acetoin utilization deacetylase AcuC-like enzyme